jgi:anhydro-N-acetylmuramic acid kinase
LTAKSIKYHSIGLMSGTSLDGLDIAYCSFGNIGKKWNFDVLQAKTIKYPKNLAEKLAKAPEMSAIDFWKLHGEFGNFCGKEVKKFIEKHKAKPQLIASHGHTIFHQPQNGFTCQIGDGAKIAAITGVNTICDFRSLDVALNGQGAPLVPIGDKLLFGSYEACLNIGGIANISFQQKSKTIAFDICPANIVFNYYANKLGKDYDKGGAIAKAGQVNIELLNQLNALAYYKQKGQRSLGREWIEKSVFPLSEKSKLSIEDKMATAIEHSAFQIAAVLNKNQLKNLLITGGGAYNTFLVERIKAHTKCKLMIPDKTTIEFKEAILFAFLGVLRLTEQVNCLSTVTGAKRDNIGGAVYYGGSNLMLNKKLETSN